MLTGLKVSFVINPCSAYVLVVLKSRRERVVVNRAAERVLYCWEEADACRGAHSLIGRFLCIYFWQLDDRGLPVYGDKFKGELKSFRSSAVYPYWSSNRSLEELFRFHPSSRPEKFRRPNFTGLVP